MLFTLNVYKRENLDASGLSNEALQNIASVYADTKNVASFNNVNITGNVNFAQFKGIICAWSGAVADIPKGWGFCDGTLYTALDGTKLQSPDLRGRFIVTAGQGTNLTNRNVNDKGGAETHTLTTGEIPNHTHSALYSVNNWTNSAPTYGFVGIGTNGSVNKETNWGNDPRTGTSLGGGPHNNMPPFYALAYIIKL